MMNARRQQHNPPAAPSTEEPRDGTGTELRDGTGTEPRNGDGAEGWDRDSEPWEGLCGAAVLGEAKQEPEKSFRRSCWQEASTKNRQRQEQS